MRITERELRNAAILDLRGDLTGHRAPEALEASVRRLVANSPAQLVISLKGVALIDVGGLGALTRAYSLCREANTALKLAHILHRLDNLLVITRLITVFDTVNSVEEAIGDDGTLGAAPAAARPSERLLAHATPV